MSEFEYDVVRGKIVELVPNEVEDDRQADLEESVRQAEQRDEQAKTAYNTAETASAEAERIAETKADELDLADKEKKAAAADLSKSRARLDSWNRAKESLGAAADDGTTEDDGSDSEESEEELDITDRVHVAAGVESADDESEDDDEEDE